MADTQCVIRIAEDGTETKHFPAKGRKFDYKELQGFVGGMLEGVPGIRYKGKIVRSAYANEEGLLLGLPHNPKASDMWEGGKRSAEYMGERYYGLSGPVILVLPRDPDPAT